MTSKYKIESDHEIPVGRYKSKWRSLVDKMKYGDSILVGSISERNGLAAAIRKQLGSIPVTRKISETEFRVWKTKDE